MNNITDAVSFFKFLNNSPKAIFTCAWFDVFGAILPGYSCCFYSVKDIEAKCSNGAAEEAGATLHTTLLETNGLGRKTRDMKGVRVLCLDLDRKVQEADLDELKNKFKCHLIVESSPGKYHVYWKVSVCIPIERWSLYQLGIAEVFLGDKNLSQPAHMMRVPGFERVCKDGTIFVPNIVYKVDVVMELTEKGVLAQFPDIVKWGEIGKKKMMDERAEMGRLARLAWKGGLREKHFKQMPEKGRNTAIYFTIKDLVYEENLDFETTYLRAQIINKCFPAPLDDRELSEVVKKAWNKAKAGLEKAAEKREAAVKLLYSNIEIDKEVLAESVNDESAFKRIAKEEIQRQLLVADSIPDERQELCVVATVGGNGHKKDAEISLSEGETNFSDQGIDPVVDPVIEAFATAGVEAAGVEAAPETVAPPEIEPTEPPEIVPRKASSIPKSLMHAAEKLSDVLWAGEGPERGAGSRGLALGRVLAASLRCGQYMQLGKAICSTWGEIGAFRKGEICVYLRGFSRWRSEVFYSVVVNKELFQSIVCQFVSKFTLIARETEELKEDLKKIPTQHQLGAIAGASWAVAQTWPVEERQSRDVIVFQNGVFDLRSGAFKEDFEAPLKHSHAVWCNWDDRTARELLEGLDKPWSVCPRLERYMEDWFPGDRVITRVLLRYFGYAMCTDYGRQKFAFFYGPTRAGKGSLARLICAIVGDSNYCTADYSMLDGDFKTAQMHGKLVVTFEEVEGTPKEHEKRMGYLKKLLGGERVIFNRKYQEPFQDEVIGKFIFQSNEPPNYQDKGHAIRARMIPIGFERSFEGMGLIDPAIEILKAEADKLGTLAALSWYKAREELDPFELAGSKALEVGKAEISDTIDVIGSTVRRYLKSDSKGRIRSTVLLELIRIVAELKESYLPKRSDLKLKREIMSCYPMIHYSNRFSFENHVVGRGYTGITIDCENLFNDFPEIEDSFETYRITFPNLIEVLETLKKCLV